MDSKERGGSANARIPGQHAPARPRGSTGFMPRGSFEAPQNPQMRSMMPGGPQFPRQPGGFGPINTQPQPPFGGPGHWQNAAPRPPFQQEPGSIPPPMQRGPPARLPPQMPASQPALWRPSPPSHPPPGARPPPPLAHHTAPLQLPRPPTPGLPGPPNVRLPGPPNVGPGRPQAQPQHSMPPPQHPLPPQQNLAQHPQPLAPPAMPAPTPAAPQPSQLPSAPARQKDISASQPAAKSAAEKPSQSAEEVAALKEKEEAVSRAWTAHRTDDGQVYYFNLHTNESSWSKPEGFTGEAGEAVPTSQLRVPGTVWFEVHCKDGRKYYYSERTQETSWTAPAAVAAVKQQVQEAKAGIPASTTRSAANGILPASDKDEMDVSYTEDDVSLPPLPTEQPLGAPPPLPPEEGLPPQQGQLPDSSRELIVSEFQDLLSEKGVTPFSRWERELPKLISDPRFQAVPSLKDRKQLFEDFCKSSAEHRRRAKGSASQANDKENAVTGFSALLQEASSTEQQTKDGEEGESAAPQMILHASTSYGNAEKQLGKDPRWQACSESQRRSLFEAKLAELKAGEKQLAKKDAETSEAEYRALLVSSGINGSSRWSKSKDGLAKDARYKALSRDNRERVFRDFVALQVKEEKEREVERKEQEKREKAVKERLKRDAEEADRRRKKAAHADGIANYMTLLNEVVKEPDAHWSEWKSKLQRDPQRRADRSVLDSKEAESRFRDHVIELHKKACNAFTELLNEVIAPLLPASKDMQLPSELRSFSKAEDLWSSDPRPSRLSSKEREKLWRRFVDEIVLERDDPEHSARRARLTMRGRMTDRDRDRPFSRDEKGQTDKAYEREYLAPDRKRLRKD